MRYGLFQATPGPDGLRQDLFFGNLAIRQLERRGKLVRFTSSRNPACLPLRPRSSGQRGAAIAEAAFTLPILFLLIFGIFGFGLLMSSYQSTVDAAREGARYGSAPIATGSYGLPTPAQIAQQTCTYLRTGVFGGNQSCNKYVTGSTAPPALTSCSTDATFLSKTAAEDIYVGVTPAPAAESYTVTGAGGTISLSQGQVVVGIRKKITIPVLNYTMNLSTCSSMRSENN